MDCNQVISQIRKNAFDDEMSKIGVSKYDKAFDRFSDEIDKIRDEERLAREGIAKEHPGKTLAENISTGVGAAGGGVGGYVLGKKLLPFIEDAYDADLKGKAGLAVKIPAAILAALVGAGVGKGTSHMINRMASPQYDVDVSKMHREYSFNPRV